jgi:hypothetical protein
MEEIIVWNNVQKVLEDYAIELRNTYQDNLINHDRIATGDLLNSVNYIIEYDNVKISVSLELASYWKYVEWDTKPHFPPMDKIREWIVAKPILPTPDKNGKLPTEKQLTYLIARKISEVGTKGSQDLHEAISVINDKYREKIREAITKDISSAFHVFFSELFYKNS